MMWVFMLNMIVLFGVNFVMVDVDCDMLMVIFEYIEVVIML